MKTRLLLSILTLAGYSSYGQYVQYQKSDDLGSDDYANKIIYNSAVGDYVVAGSSNSNLGGSYDMSLMFVDMAGTLLTQGGMIGGSAGEVGRTLNIASSGEITLAGSTQSFSTSPSNTDDFMAIHLDNLGEFVWLKVWGSDSLDVGQSVNEANDGNVVMAGRSKRRDTQRTDALVVKLSSVDGDTIWAKEVGTTYINEAAYDIFPIGAQGYVMVGWSGANAIGVNDALAVLLDEAGDKQLAFYFGGPGEDDARSFVDWNIPGVFYIAGNTRNIGAGGGDAYLARFDASLGTPTMDWFRTYGGSSEESLQAAIRTNDGSVLLVGTTNSFGNGQEGFVVKVDGDGAILWSNVYGGAGDDFLQSIAENNDGEYVACGASNSFGGNASDVWFVAMDEVQGSSSCGWSGANFVEESIASNVAFMVTSHGTLDDLTSTNVTLIDRIANPNPGELSPTETVLCTTVGVNDASTTNAEMTLYPVPTSKLLNVTFPAPDKYTVTLYSTDGRVVYTDIVIGNGLAIDIETLSEGIYVLEAVGSNGILTSKVLKD